MSIRPPLPSVRRLLAATLVFSAVAFLRAGEPDLSSVPGSAQLAPKPLEDPTPVLPKGGQSEAGALLGLWISPDGKVEDAQYISGPQAWKQACLETVKRWRFEPVTWEGKALPARVQLSFAKFGKEGVSYNLSPLPNLPPEVHAEDEWGLKAPVPQRDPDLVLPLISRASHTPVIAAFDYVVEPDGRPDHFRLLGANSEDSLRALLCELTACVYRPGTVKGVPVAVRLKQAISVSGTDPIPAGLAGLSDGYDPVYPYECLMKRVTGSATVKLELEADGSVRSVEVTDATRPEFGEALAAAAYGWRYDPASAAATPERTYAYEFSMDNVAGSTLELAGRLAKGEQLPRTLAGLDAPPKRVFSPALRYPPSLKAQGVDGSAKIEFIIDRFGLVQLPHVLEASRPEFGWAAANWIGCMRFERLTRGGRPTEQKLIVPVSFKAKPGPTARQGSPKA